MTSQRDVLGPSGRSACGVYSSTPLGFYQVWRLSGCGCSGLQEISGCNPQRTAKMAQVISKLRDTFLGFAKLAYLHHATAKCRSVTPRDQRHLLLIVHAFPPDFTPGVHRPLSLVQYACRAGWKVTVLARQAANPTPGGEQLRRGVDSNVKVIRWEPSLQLSYRFFPSIDGGMHHALAAMDAVNSHIPEVPYSIVVASGPPFSTFLAACGAGAHFEIPVILDYRDEWTECPFSFVRSCSSDRYWERRCLRAAHSVIYTTQSQKTHAIATFPRISMKKAVVISNGWEPQEHLHVSGTHRSKKDSNAFILSFVGTLGHHTLPDSFLATLSDVLKHSQVLRERFHLYFIGKTVSEAKQQLNGFAFSDHLHHVDALPKFDALSSMYDSDALLLLNDPMFSRYLPGKLFDYLATGLPVLVYGDGGEIGRLISALNAGVIVPLDDPHALREALEKLGHATSTPARDPDQEVQRNWLKQHTRERVAEQMLELFGRYHDSAHRPAADVPEGNATTPQASSPRDLQR